MAPTMSECASIVDPLVSSMMVKCRWSIPVGQMVSHIVKMGDAQMDSWCASGRVFNHVCGSQFVLCWHSGCTKPVSLVCGR